MDAKSKEILNNILQKSPETLSEEEAGFILARRNYLNKTQKKEFSEIIYPKPNPEDGTVKKDAKTKK